MKSQSFGRDGGEGIGCLLVPFWGGERVCAVCVRVVIKLEVERNDEMRSAEIDLTPHWPCVRAFDM